MIGLAHGLQDHVGNYVPACVAFFGILEKARIQIVFFAVDLVVEEIERLGAQRPSTRHADKTRAVVDLIHGLARFRSAHHWLRTFRAITVVLVVVLLVLVLLPFKVFLDRESQVGQLFFDLRREMQGRLELFLLITFAVIDRANGVGR